MENKYTVAGIISGVGNIYGFYQAGFKPLFLTDNRNFIKKGIDTVIRNMPGCIYSDDINKFKEMNPTVIISSPSCAQVSLLGMKREDRASLNTMPMEDFEFIQTLNILFERQPEFFIVEYLRNFLNYFKITFEGISRKVTNQFLEFPSDYRVQIIELNSLTYGVPQSRNRLFLFFSKKKYDYIYIPPSEYSLTAKTVGEVFRDLEKAREERDLPNDLNPKHNKGRVAGFNKLKPGESYYGGQNNRRLRMGQYCPVITSHCTRHVHPLEPRTINVREAATFQGFPLGFQFYGSNTIQLDLVGKTIPPPLTKHFGETIKESIEKYENANISADAGIQ